MKEFRIKGNVLHYDYGAGYSTLHLSKGVELHIIHHNECILLT